MYAKEHFLTYTNTRLLPYTPHVYNALMTLGCSFAHNVGQAKHGVALKLRLVVVNIDEYKGALWLQSLHFKTPFQVWSTYCASSYFTNTVLPPVINKPERFKTSS